MSGKKQMTIDSAEYQRLRAQAERLRQLNANLPELVEASRAAAVADAARQFEPVARRQEAQQRRVEGLARQLREAGAETNRKLEEQSRETARLIAGMDKKLRSELRAAIEEQGRRIEQAVADERKARQKAMDAVNTRLRDMASTEAARRDAGRNWLEAVRRLDEFIEGNYRHEFFAPGRLAALRRQMELAFTNLEQGLSEACVAQAQSAYMGLDDLRLDLERQEQEWRMWKAAALATAAEVLAIAHAHRKCQAVGLKGETLDTQIEVDWWTEGKIERIEREVAQARANAQADNLSGAELKALAEDTLPSLRARVEDAVEEARSKVVASQLRINIADLIVESLEAKGYRIEDSTYAGDDMREGYVAKVTRVDGTEVVVTVDPDNVEPGRNRVQIHSFDETSGSQHERTQRAREIGDALRSEGIEASIPTEAGPQGDPAVRDIQRVRRRVRKQTEAATTAR